MKEVLVGNDGTSSLRTTLNILFIIGNGEAAVDEILRTACGGDFSILGTVFDFPVSKSALAIAPCDALASSIIKLFRFRETCVSITDFFFVVVERRFFSFKLLE